MLEDKRMKLEQYGLLTELELKLSEKKKLTEDKSLTNSHFIKHSQ